MGEDAEEIGSGRICFPDKSFNIKVIKSYV
jgi:hypothetical protein